MFDQAFVDGVCGDQETDGSDRKKLALVFGNEVGLFESLHLITGQFCFFRLLFTYLLVWMICCMVDAWDK